MRTNLEPGEWVASQPDGWADPTSPQHIDNQDTAHVHVPDAMTSMHVFMQQMETADVRAALSTERAAVNNYVEHAVSDNFDPAKLSGDDYLYYLYNPDQFPEEEVDAAE